MEKGRILLVEDDKELSFIMKRLLESNGYEVVAGYSIQEAEAILARRDFELILMDMMLPDGSGDELCGRIRERSFCPILFLSCMGDSGTKIQALEKGGDDYITKPVDFEELLTRIHVNIRRAKQYNAGRAELQEERIPGFSIRRGCREVWRLDCAGRALDQVELSYTEYELLLCFLDQPDKLLLYQDLYQRVWGADDLGDVRTVMVHVSNLRKKLGDQGKLPIHTVRGAGYLFRREA